VTSQDWTELLRFAGQTLIVGVGWWLVNRQNVARERDKARREMVVKNADALSDAVDAIFKEAREYHTKADRDHGLEIALKINLQTVSLRVSQLLILTGDPEAITPIELAVVRLRRAITQRHFEDEHDGALQMTSPQSQDIASGVLDVKHGLQQVKHDQFAAPAPSFAKRIRSHFAR
jgi:hypothetical protein